VRSRGRCGPAPGRGLDRSRWPFRFQRCCTRTRPGLPGSLVIHPVALRRSPTPVGPVRLASGGGPGAAPLIRTRRHRRCLSRGSVGRFATRCVRFTTHIAVRHATRASGWQAAPLPGGSRTRWITMKGFKSSCPPFQGLAWRNASQTCCKAMRGSIPTAARLYGLDGRKLTFGPINHFWLHPVFVEPCRIYTREL